MEVTDRSSKEVSRYVSIAILVLVCFTSTSAQTPSEALALQERGDWAGAEAAWRGLVRTSPKDYRYWTSLGACLAHQNRFAEAIEDYKKALAISPHDGQTNFNLGLAYFKLGNLERAIAPLRTAETAMPQAQQQTNVLLGMSYYGTGRHKEAIPYLEAAQKEKPDNGELQLVLAKAYLLAKEYDKAKLQFGAMLERNPDSAQVHMLLGEAYDGSGKQEAALQEFRIAAGSGAVPDAHFGLGYLLWRDKHYDEAAEEFRRELAINPKHHPSLAYLGDVLLKSGNAGNAKKTIQESIAVKDTLWITHYDLGIIAANEKNYARAIEQFKHALAMNNKRPEIHYHLAQAYKATNQSAEAQKELRIVSSLHEKDTEDLVTKVSGAQ
jgi:tetratricopeptide (TPR) repeat protein